VLIGDRAFSDEDLGKSALEGLLFQSPAPVLITPKAHVATLQPRTVMIGWDSRDETGRAIRAAMELLVKANSVRIVVVDPDASPIVNGEEPDADIAAYLGATMQRSSWRCWQTED
jgi:hypothetical protein